MNTVTIKRGGIPKNDHVMLRKVRRYVRRHGGSVESAYETIKLMLHSSPKDAEKRLAAAMRRECMNPVAVKKAVGGYWSDWKSPLAFPKKDLVDMLRQGGRMELAERVEDGEFDG